VSDVTSRDQNSQCHVRRNRRQENEPCTPSRP
jgi:hypothetical protein